MLEVTVRIFTCSGVAHDVRAEVERPAPGRYELAWSDWPALHGLSLTPSQLHYLRRRCEEAYDEIEREREALGIAGLLDDSEPLLSGLRDSREEVAAA